MPFDRFNRIGLPFNFYYTIWNVETFINFSDPRLSSFVPATSPSPSPLPLPFAESIFSRYVADNVINEYCKNFCYFIRFRQTRSESEAREQKVKVEIDFTPNANTISLMWPRWFIEICVRMQGTKLNNCTQWCEFGSDQSDGNGFYLLIAVSGDFLMRILRLLRLHASQLPETDVSVCVQCACNRSSNHLEAIICIYLINFGSTCSSMTDSESVSHQHQSRVRCHKR